MSIRKGVYNALLLVQFLYILETSLEIKESKRKKKVHQMYTNFDISKSSY